MKAVIFDVDGTLADCQHRRHFVEGDKKDWDSFFDPKLVMQDTVIKPIAELTKLFFFDGWGTKVLIVTARRFEDLEVTREWLSKNNVPHHGLYIRKKDDKRDDAVFKREVLQQIREEGYDVQMVFDDRDRVVKMWRDEGLTCLQVAPGNF